MTQLMSQEAAQQNNRSTGARLLRTTSLRTPIDSRTRVIVHNGSDKTSSQTQDMAQDMGSGDTGFFDSPEDYGEPGKVSLYYADRSIKDPRLCEPAIVLNCFFLSRIFSPGWLQWPRGEQHR